MNSSTFQKQIDIASSIPECKKVKNALEALLGQINSKLTAFEEEAKEAGLSFEGKNAVDCCCEDCDNTMDEDGEYIRNCDGCEDLVCVDCMRECNYCFASLCQNSQGTCPLSSWCEDCCEPLCSNCGKKCENCGGMTCPDCIKTLGPYDREYCHECWDHLNYDDRQMGPF